MGSFTLQDVYHGKGTLETLKTFEGKHTMICTFHEEVSLSG